LPTPPDNTIPHDNNPINPSTNRLNENVEQPDIEPVPESHPPSEHAEKEPNPVEVPIPDDDDELYAETYPTLHVEADQCWKFEVPICALDVARWKEEAKPHEMSFLVSAAKRQRSEVKLT